MLKKTLLILFILLAVSSYTLISQDIAQWQGPDRDGSYPDAALISSWPDGGPPLLWKAEGIGKGFSSAVSDGRRVYVTGMKDTTDYLTAFAMDGKLIWQIPFGRSWYGSFPDTRTTPTVENDRVYVVSGAGEIACVDAAGGKIIWHLNGVERFGGVPGDWGVSESLLLVGDRLIFTPAGQRTTMVALDKFTGNTVWQTESLEDTGAYVSPLLIHFANRDIAVTVTGTWFFGTDVANGLILWKYNYARLLPEESLKIWPGAPHTNTITPLFYNGCIFLTGGYNHPGAMFRIQPDAKGVELIWTSPVLDCHHGGVVRVDSCIYGSNWIDNSKGNWCCLDWGTGKTHYEASWNTKGAIISADGMLYCFDEKAGNLTLVRATPEKFEPVSNFRVTAGKGPYWAHPVIHSGVLYIRHGDALMAYDLRHP